MLKLEEVSKVYCKTHTKALDSISLDIPKRQIVGLLGPNGAGKTTLVKIICGLIIPDKGLVMLCGKSLLKSRTVLMGKLGIVMEGARNLYWRASVSDNLIYFGSLKGVARMLVKERIEKYKYILGINDLLDRKVNTLSAGQKQRVALTASILHEPELLILDEPTNGLDIESREMLIKGIAELRKSLSATVLIASHDVDFLRKCADRFIVISKGSITGDFINEECTNEYIEEKYHISINS